MLFAHDGQRVVLRTADGEELEWALVVVPGAWGHAWRVAGGNWPPPGATHRVNGPVAACAGSGRPPWFRKYEHTFARRTPPEEPWRAGVRGGGG